MSDEIAWDARYSSDANHIRSILAMLPDLRARSGTLGAIRGLRISQASVLEIGCGTGQHSVALGQEFPTWRFEAIDTSPKAVEAAAALVEAANLPIRISLGDAATLPFSDETFDIVFGDHVIGHIPDRAQAEREIVRVLKPGGYCVFNSGNTLRIDGWPLYHAMTQKKYLARTFFPWTLAREFRALRCLKSDSFGSVLLLKRSLSLLSPHWRVRAVKGTVKTGTVTTDGRKRGVVRRLYRFVESHTPAWLMTDYGIVVRKLAE